MPAVVSALNLLQRCRGTYPHGGMEGSSNLIILLESRAASEDFRQPELAHGTLHVTDFALSRGRCPHPLRGFTAHPAYHVGMGEGLGGALNGLDIEARRNRLGDARMKRRRATWNHERVLSLVASCWPVSSSWSVASRRSDEGRVISQRRAHGDGSSSSMADMFNAIGYET